MSSLQPDYKFIDVAEKSNQPKDWLLHPTGYVFQFDAQKAQKPALTDSMPESDAWSDTWLSDYGTSSSDSTSKKSRSPVCKSDTFTKRLKAFLTCSFE